MTQPAEKKYFLCTGQVVAYSKLHEHVGAHIIGHLIYVTDEGRKVTALALWVKPMPTDQVPPVMPEIVAHLVGDARQIRCRFPGCDRRERWEIGKSAFLALMTRYKKDVFVEVRDGG